MTRPNEIEIVVKSTDQTKGFVETRRNAKDLTRDIAQVEAELKALGRVRSKPEIDADTKVAETKIAATQARLDELRAKPTSPKVEADIAVAERNLQKLEGQLAALRGEAAAQINVRADTKSAEARLRELRAQLAGAGDDSEKLGKSTGGLAKSVDLAEGAFKGAARSILTVGSAVNFATGPVVGLASSVGTMSGILGALPAVALSGAASMAVFKLATVGVADAFSAGLSGDVEAFGEASKKLAPSARAAAEAVRDFGPAARKMQQSVQNAFFNEWSGELHKVGTTLLPAVSGGMQDVALQAGQTGKNLLHVATSAGAINDLKMVLSGTADMFDGLKTAPADVLDGILALAGQGSRELGGLGDVISVAAKDFRDWAAAAVEAGKVKVWIADAKKEFQLVGAVLGNVGSIVSTVFGGLSTGGYSFMESLEKGTAALDEFLKSAQGQDILRELGQTLGVVSEVARDVLMTALRELGPVVVELAPAAREVAKAIGATLVDALKTAGPILQDIARFLSEHKDVLADLVPIVMGAVGAYKGFKILTEVKGWADGALGALKLLGGASTGAAGSAAGGGFAKSLLGGLKGGLTGAAVSVIGLELADQLIPKDAGDSLGVGFARDMLGEMAETFRGEGDIFQAWNVGQWIANPLSMAVEMGKRKLMELAGFKPPASIEIPVRADGSILPEDLVRLKQEAEKTKVEVKFEGRKESAFQALADIEQAARQGKAEVEINGNKKPIEQARQEVIDQLNATGVTVQVGGDTLPLGDAVARGIGVAQSKPAIVKVDGNIDPVTGKVTTAVEYANGQKGTLTLDGNPTLVNDKTVQAVVFADGSKGTITLDGNPDPATGKVWATVAYADGSTGRILVDAKTDAANRAIDSTARDRYSTIWVTYQPTNGRPAGSFNASTGAGTGRITGDAHGGVVGGGLRWVGERGPELVRAMAGGGAAPGGMTWVGERGPELVQMPPGSLVYPTGQSQQMAAAGGGGGAVRVELAAAPGADGAVATLIMQLVRTGKIQIRASQLVG